jgi:hypothetical protein
MPNTTITLLHTDTHGKNSKIREPQNEVEKQFITCNRRKSEKEHDFLPD